MKEEQEMKKAIALILSLMLLATACVMLPAAASAEAMPMYVYTANGKTLNVRSSPETGNNIIGRLKYGEEVLVEFINSTGWAVILWGSEGEAWVQARYLQDTPPGPKPEPSEKEKEAEELKAEQNKLNKELKSEKEIEPFYGVVRATRVTGSINFRVGPGKITTRIESLPDGKELLVIGETTNWYRARDPQTNQIGYIYKNFVTRINKELTNAPAEDGKRTLGSLNVNGEFDLVCALPDGFDLQYVNMQGSKIVASILSQDMTKPKMYLTIAFDETYSSVDRMNDMSDDDLALLEDTFKDMNDVSISYAETGHGTKLMVVKETGSDDDFVDILAIYKGYFIEFKMVPNENAADKTLTDEQIEMCVKFLTELDFNPVQK